VNKFTLAALLVLSAASTAQAADQGSGKITWSGSVVASACSLKAGENGDDQNIGLKFSWLAVHLAEQRLKIKSRSRLMALQI